MKRTILHRPNALLMAIAAGAAALVFVSARERPADTRPTLDRVLDIAISSNDSQMIEFPRLYDDLFDAIPDDAGEKLILVEKLKQRGFELTDQGRGNFPPLGPRIVAATMTKGNCRCEISKIYYDTISDSAWSASERIRCVSQTVK